MNTDQRVQHDKLSLLTPVQMGRADRAAEASGVDEFGLMEAAGSAAAGWPVKLALLGSRENLTGEAAHAAGLWKGDVVPFSSESLDGAGIVIDAIFRRGPLAAIGWQRPCACGVAKNAPDTHLCGRCSQRP